MKYQRLFTALLSLSSLALLALVGCAGGGGTSSNPVIPPSSITVAVSPSSTSILLGNTLQFNAMVSGTSNTAVTWSVNGIAGGNSSFGTINTNGLYTAPADLPNSAAVSITATSQADSSARGTASITITSDIAIAISSKPANTQPIQPGETIQLNANVTSAGRPDTTVLWAVNGVPNGNATVGQITITGTLTATYTAPATLPLNSIRLSASSRADASRSNSELFTVLLAVSAVSNTSPIPLTPLQITTSGLDPTVAVLLQFSNGAGYTVTESPIRVAPDGTVVAGVPLFVDPVSGQIGPGAVSLVVMQAGQSSAPTSINIADLPALSTYGTTPGEISHAMLVMQALLISRRLNELQAFQAAVGNKADTSQAQVNLANILPAVIKARSDVDRVTLNSTLVINEAVLSDGTPIQFDATTLDLMDRIQAVLLNQTFATIMRATPAAAAAKAQAAKATVRHVRYSQLATERLLLHPAKNTPSGLLRLSMSTPMTAQTSGAVRPEAATAPSLKDVLDLMETFNASKEFTDSAQEAQNSSNLADEVSAIARGLGPVIGLVDKNTAFGMVLSAVGSVNTILQAGGDLGGWMLAEATGQTDVAAQKAQDFQSIPRDKLYDAIESFALLPFLDNPAVLAGATVFDFMRTVAGYIDPLLSAPSASPSQIVDQGDFAVVTSNSTVATSSLTGIAEALGNVNVPNTLGIEAPQSGINLTVGTDIFTTLADTAGNYDLFFPLGLPGDNYATSDFTVIDPLSTINLGSLTFDLSGASITTPTQIPTIQAAPCNDADAGAPDDDDPDCD